MTQNIALEILSMLKNVTCFTLEFKECKCMIVHSLKQMADFH